MLKRWLPATRGPASSASHPRDVASDVAANSGSSPVDSDSTQAGPLAVLGPIILPLTRTSPVAASSDPTNTSGPTSLQGSTGASTALLHVVAVLRQRLLVGRHFPENLANLP